MLDICHLTNSCKPFSSRIKKLNLQLDNSKFDLTITPES